MNDDIATICKGLTRGDLLTMIERLSWAIYGPTASRMVRDHANDIRHDTLRQEADRLFGEYQRLSAERRALFPEGQGMTLDQRIAYFQHLQQGEEIYKRYQCVEGKLSALFEARR